MANDNQNGQSDGPGGYPLSSWLASIAKHAVVYGALWGFAMFALLVLNK